jgi:hypothetical protein
MLVKTAYTSLIGGVSQQPPAVRRMDQCGEMMNCVPSPVDGATKRPPTQHKAKVINGAVPTMKCHTIYRDGVEQYFVIFKSNGIVVWDIEANVARNVIDNTGGFGYLSTLTSEDDLAVKTIADYTFVANRNTTVAMSTAKTSATPTGAKDDAFIFVRQGNYASEYQVKFRIGVTNYSYTCKTFDGNNSIGVMPGAIGTGSIDSVKTIDIAADLAAQITAAGIANLTVAREGSVVRLYTSGSTVITNITTNDSIGDTSLLVVHNEVPRVQGYLPEICYSGFKVKVIGDAEVDGDNYYVEFVTDDPTNRPFARGYWRETVAADSEYEFNASTMPHRLTRVFNLGVPEFHWDVVPWDDRTVGDQDLVPNPSFVGKTINEIFFYKDRLAFLADETVNLTETGEYFNFFRATLLTLEDTAPIDVSLNHERVAILRNATPYAENMLLFSDRTQFLLVGGDILSPRTIQIPPVSEFENLTTVRPFASGRSVFFAFPRGSQTGIRELFQLGDTLRFDAVDITTPVPDYISGSLKEIAGSTLEDIIVCRSDEDLNKLFVYKYLWNGQEKVQSAWFSWDLGTGSKVHHFSFIENSLVILVERTGGLYYERIELASGLVDPGAQYVMHLDRRVDDTACSFGYEPSSDETVVTPPYTLESGATYEVVSKLTGIRHQTRVSGATLVVRGDVSTSDLWIGQAYTAYIDLTPPLVKLEVGRGVSAEYTPTQTVLKGTLTYSDSRVIKVDVRAGTRPVYRYTLGAYQPGVSNLNQVAGIYIDSDVIHFVTGDVDPDLFKPGVIFSVTGTENNDGLYTVDTVTGTSIATVESLVNEGSVSSPIPEVVLETNPSIGTVTLLSGDLSFHVMESAERTRVRVINDSPYPCKMGSIQWQIRYYARGRRLG